MRAALGLGAVTLLLAGCGEKDVVSRDAFAEAVKACHVPHARYGKPHLDGDVPYLSVVDTVIQVDGHRTRTGACVGQRLAQYRYGSLVLEAPGQGTGGTGQGGVGGATGMDQADQGMMSGAPGQPMQPGQSQAGQAQPTQGQSGQGAGPGASGGAGSGGGSSGGGAGGSSGGGR